MKLTSKKILLWLIVGGAVGGMLYVFPPFHIVPLDEAKAKSLAKEFDAASFAADFWNDRLTGLLDSAIEARQVLDAIGRDRLAAKNRYGKVVGLDGPHHYFLKGTGRIIAIHDQQIEISLSGNQTDQPDIILVTSMIFGNEVLNATQLLNRSQFQRTNDYNAVSAEVNVIVETQVVPPFLEKAKIGTTVHFVGCSTKVSDDDPTPIPMYLVPVKLETE